MKNVQQEKGKKMNLLQFIVSILILYLLIKYLNIITTWKAQLNWWKVHGGKKYDVSFFNIYASYSNWFWYYFSRFSTSPINTLDLTQIRFFIDYIMKYMYYIDQNGDSQGVILPVHIAETVKLDKGQGLKDFDIWYDKGVDSGVIDTKKPLYPDNEDIDGWKKRIAKWAGVHAVDDFWVAEKGLFVPTNALSWKSNWADTKKNPDNFLARSGITPNSPIIIAYINGSYNDPNTGLLLDPAGFRSLLGNKTGNLGGWLGFLLHYQSKSVSSDQYYNILYTSYSPQPNPPNNSCGDKVAGWTSAIASSAASGIGTGAMIGMIGGPVGVAGGVFAGLAIAGLGLFSHAESTKNC